jgi:hypothetical protein
LISRSHARTKSLTARICKLQPPFVALRVARFV